LRCIPPLDYGVCLDDSKSSAPFVNQKKCESHNDAQENAQFER
jgi:hypothetical protein